MTAANLQNPIFTDKTKAREWLEARVWPTGPVCPHCGVTSEHVTKLEGEKHRPGVYQCNACREQFTVTVKTVFERSKIPLSKWLAALFMLTASKKGVSAHQIHRSLGISYKSAWFMMHRLREALRSGSFAPMGGAGQIVEIDETLMGKVEGAPKKLHTGGSQNRNIVLTLVERGGRARSFHVDGTAISDLIPIVRENIAKESDVMTDQATWYKTLAETFESHRTVNHGDEEYVRNEVTIDAKGKLNIDAVHTNTVEGFYSVFKRGMKGVYQHCKEKHLHRYLAEFDFRYNTRTRLGFNDLMRAEIAAAGIKGKRLTYRRPHKQGQVAQD
jgi:transposase-like protein